MKRLGPPLLAAAAMAASSPTPAKRPSAKKTKSIECGGDLARARAAYTAGDPRTALQILTCLKERHPADPEPRRLLSDIHAWQGRSEPSVREAAEALALPGLDPQSPEARHLRARAARLKLGAELSAQRSPASSGINGTFEATYRYLGLARLQAGVDRLSRAYDQGPLVSNTRFRLSHTAPVSPRAYLEVGAAYAPDSSFIARWAVAAEPRLALDGDAEIGIRVAREHYPERDLTALRPNWQKNFGDDWRLGGDLHLIFAGRTAASGIGRAAYAFHGDWELRAWAGGGRSYEGNGIFDRYWSTAGALRWQSSAAMTWQTSVSAHRGQVVREDRFGLGLEWTL